MFKRMCLAGVAFIGLTTAASAQTSFTSNNNAYNGSQGGVSFSFNAPLPNGFSLNGGTIYPSSQNGTTLPVGATGNYLAADVGTPATISSSTGYDNVQFLWGSIDPYNTVKYFDQAGKLLGQLTGSQVGAVNNSDFLSPDRNRYVTFSVDPSTGDKISSVQLLSSATALEAANFSFYNNGQPTPVPEPGTMALFGFGALGLLALSRRRLSLFA